jgi:hypothetical protein
MKHTSIRIFVFAANKFAEEALMVSNKVGKVQHIPLQMR